MALNILKGGHELTVYDRSPEAIARRAAENMALSTSKDLLPFLTAEENVSVVLDLAGWPSAKGRARARELLDYLEVGHRAKAKPALLSGGEAQRVAIARALANRPRIILADEPTAALDSGRAQLVMDLLRKLATEQEACIIAVTHDEKIFDRFDRLIHLRDGRLVDS